MSRSAVVAAVGRIGFVVEAEQSLMSALGCCAVAAGQKLLGSWSCASHSLFEPLLLMGCSSAADFERLSPTAVLET